MASPNQFTSYKLDQYKEIQQAWREICQRFTATFLEGNRYNLRFPESECLTVKEFSLLDHACRVSLTPFLTEDRVMGQLHFGRVSPNGDDTAILTVYIDEYGNAGLDPIKQVWNLSPRGMGTDLSRFALSLTEALFLSFNKHTNYDKYK